MFPRVLALAFVFAPALVTAQPLPTELWAVTTVPASGGAQAYVVVDTVVPPPTSPLRVPLWQEDNLEPSAVLLGPELPSRPGQTPFTLVHKAGRACVAEVARERPLGYESEHTGTEWRRALRVTSAACDPTTFSWALEGAFSDVSYQEETRLEPEQLPPREQRAIRAHTQRDEYVLGLARLPSGALHVTLARRAKTAYRTIILTRGRATARFPGIASWAFATPRGLAFYGRLSTAVPVRRLWPR